MSRPRIRSLKPECWQDEALGAVSRDARLLFVGLITQADDAGRLKAAIPLLRSQIFPYDHELPLAEIEGWLAELSGVGVVRLYEAGGRSYAALGGWAKNQKVDHAKDSEIPGPPENPPADALASPREDSREDAKPSETALAKPREDSPSRAAARSDPIRSDPQSVATGSKPPPTPPQGGRSRDRDRYKQDCASYAAEHFPDLGDQGGEAIRQATRGKDGATSHEAVVEFVDRWWRKTWRSAPAEEGVA